MRKIVHPPARPQPRRDGRPGPHFVPHAEEWESLLHALSQIMPRRRAAAATQAILTEFGDLAAALGAAHAELAAIPEVGGPGANLVKAIHAAALHLGEEHRRTRRVLNSTDALIAYVAAQPDPLLGGPLRLLFLDAANHLLADEAMGGCSADGIVGIEPGEILRRAQHHKARGFILIHADPSGGAVPSDAGIGWTHDIQDLAEANGLMLQDHVVIGRDGPVSLRRMGLMRGLCRIG